MGKKQLTGDKWKSKFSKRIPGDPSVGMEER
jgi:hypothetical protein